MKRTIFFLICFLMIQVPVNTFAQDKDSEIKLLTSPYYLSKGYTSVVIEYRYSKSISIGLDYLSGDDTYYYTTYTQTVFKPFIRYYGSPEERNSLFIGAGYMMKDAAYNQGSGTVLEAGYNVGGRRLTVDIGFESALNTTLPSGKTTDVLLRFGWIF